MRKLFSVLLCAGVLLAPLAADAATLTLDQSMTNDVGLAGGSTTPGSEMAQTFTPSISGPLGKVELLAFPNPGFCMTGTPVPPTDLKVSVRGTDSAGAPLVASLATAQIAPAAVLVDALGRSYVSVTFATPPTLNAGTQYALVFETVAPVGLDCSMLISQASWTLNMFGADDFVGGYPGGMLWGRSSGQPFAPSSVWDLWFKTFMSVGGSAPTSKDQCKNGGWATFTDPRFKNQGACVAYTNHS